MEAIVFLPLTRGQVAVIDFDDFETVGRFKWTADPRKTGFCAVRQVQRPDGKWRPVRLHTSLFPGVKMVDHRDGNQLNNRRYNLRPATFQQNSRGFRRKSNGRTSQFRGVYQHSDGDKWVSQISINRRAIYLGRFADEATAARAYDAAAIKHFGEFATLNFPV